MARQLLIDTDVLIDHLRDQPEAVSYVEAQQEELLICVVTVAELYAGVREGQERSRLERFLQAFTIIPIDQRLAIQGGLYRREYSKSHTVGLADALIAATATTVAGSTRDAQPEAFSHAPGCACALPQAAAHSRTKERHGADALKRAAHAWPFGPLRGRPRLSRSSLASSRFFRPETSLLDPVQDLVLPSGPTATTKACRMRIRPMRQFLTGLVACVRAGGEFRVQVGRGLDGSPSAGCGCATPG